MQTSPFLRLFLPALGIIMAVLPPAYGQTAITQRFNVLYLNSYQNGYQWSDTLLEGIKSEVAASGLNIDLHIEYMDSKIRYNQNVKMHLFALYADKYKNTQFDAIIVSDNNGFDFIRQYQGELFPGVPTVFCGVNDFDPQSIVGRPHVTGIVESFDIKANLNLAFRYHPERHKIVIVGDDSTTARAIKRQVTKAIDSMADRPAVEFLMARSLDQLSRDAKVVADKAIFYFIPFYMDQQHGRFSANEICKTLYQATGAPIYSNWKFLLGAGIVGGKMLDGYAHGATAARMTLQILKGTPVSSLPVIKPADEPYIFDNNVLNHFHISREQLPTGSTLINHTSYFIEINRQLFWVLVCGFILIAASIIVLTINIAKRRAVEHKLKEQLDFVRLLMNTIPIPIYFRAIDGTLTGCNLAFEKWFDLQRDAIVGSSLEALRQLGPGQLADAVDDELLNRTGVKSYDKRLQLKDDQNKDIILHKASYRNAKGKVVGIVGVIYDITNRKKAVEDLRESQQMLKLILDNIPQHVHWKDKDLRLIGANKSFAAFFGIDDIDTIIGQTDADLIADEQHARLSIHTDRRVVARDRAVHQMKWNLTDGDGNKVHLVVNRVPLHDHAGNVVGVLSTAEDVTQNVIFEHKLMEASKMEAIGTLAGGIAHDFNNILTAIINSTELALEDLEPETMTASDLQRSLKAARRGSRLVEQILAFSRADKAGFKPVDIAEVANEVIGLLEASLPGSVKLTTRIASEPACCMADPTQIHQVVMNLCTNAFQSIEDQGGCLTIQLAPCRLGAPQAALLDITPGPYLRLSISDDGPGIPAAIQDKIFDPFFTTKEQGKGTGLGLAVVRGIIMGHNGAIRVTSIENHQTTFDVFLPVMTDAARLTAAETDEVFGGTETILFVEDDEDQLALIPRVLSQLGYRVIARQNALQASQLLATGGVNIDLIVTDYDMPDMNGIELAAEAARHRPELPVLIVTGRKPPEEMHPLPENVLKVIAKPYNKATISNAIHQVLAHRQEQPHVHCIDYR